MIADGEGAQVLGSHRELAQSPDRNFQGPRDFDRCERGKARVARVRYHLHPIIGLRQDLLGAAAVDGQQPQRSRATEFDKGGILTRFRKHTAYIIPLSLRALKIVSDLSIAMESRAYDPYTKRTFVRELKMQRLDKIILVAMGVFLAVSIVLRVIGLGGLQLGTLGTGQ